MRLSGFVVASLLLVSTTLLAQHSSAGSGSSSGGTSSSGVSHSSYSGSSSSVSSASSHNSSSSAAHSASRGTTASHTSKSNTPSNKLSSNRENAAPEKKSTRSFLHPFRKPTPVRTAEFHGPIRCLKEPCAVCPPGESRNGKGACVAASNACLPNQSWNGLACSTQAWSNNCRALADELAAERRRMQGQNDPGESLRYQLLREQYQQCLRRFGLDPFASYAFNRGFLLDTP